MLTDDSFSILDHLVFYREYWILSQKQIKQGCEHFGEAPPNKRKKLLTLNFEVKWLRVHVYTLLL